MLNKINWQNTTLTCEQVQHSLGLGELPRFYSAVSGLNRTFFSD